MSSISPSDGRGQYENENHCPRGILVIMDDGERLSAAGETIFFIFVFVVVVVRVQVLAGSPWG